MTPYRRITKIREEVEKRKGQHVSRVELLRLIEAIVLHLQLQTQEQSQSTKGGKKQ